MQINLTSQIWKEGKMYVSYSPELDISSCGRTPEEAKKNLKEAIQAFLEEVKRMGTLKQILKESGFVLKKRQWQAPQFLGWERVPITI
ncbi:MAG: type II toxin-antitoxin system HicB family antitoxin [Candidatus Portnoybacteria bacterium]|nr:type II toxin-antitoxin system HicB family antitoxin [Candidatus Portnoybacteria bacterium]